MKTRSSTYKVPLNIDKAKDARDTFAKALFGLHFDGLVKRINQSLNPGGQKAASIIGVLDIFGFEIFEVNSFEQLCINFCNEKLQQHFTNNTFKAETKLYKDEGITVDDVSYVDNQDLLDMIEGKKTGMFAILNEEIKVPRGSSNGFYTKFIKKNAKHPRYFKVKHKKGSPKGDLFGVHHFAGDVTYLAQGFLEKNKDSLFDDLIQLGNSSDIPQVSALFPILDKKQKKKIEDFGTSVFVSA